MYIYICDVYTDWYYMKPAESVAILCGPVADPWHRPVALSIFWQRCPPQQPAELDGSCGQLGNDRQHLQGCSQLKETVVLSDGLVWWEKILWISWIAGQIHTKSQQTRWNGRTYNLAQGFPRLIIVRTMLEHDRSRTLVPCIKGHLVVGHFGGEVQLPPACCSCRWEGCTWHRDFLETSFIVIHIHIFM